MEKLKENTSCEILIIGAGITGLLAAHKLREKGHDVLVIEKDGIGCHSTRKSTGLVQYSSDIMLHKLLANHQIDGVNFYLESLKAINEVEAISQHFKDKTVFRRCPSLYLATTIEDIPMLKKEYEALSTHGFSVKEVSEAELLKDYGIFKTYGILTEDDASVHPFNYTQALAAHFQSMGGKLYEGYFLDALDGVARLKGDFTISYDFIIYALGYETVRYKPMAGVIKRASYVFCCNPLIKTQDIMVWETARPYLYQNTLAPGMVVVGGGDVDLKKYEPKNAYLPIQKLKKQYMDWYGLKDLEIDDFYSAEFFTFVDGLPKYKVEDNHIYLYPYGGNGIVYSLYLVNQLLQNVFNF